LQNAHQQHKQLNYTYISVTGLAGELLALAVCQEEPLGGRQLRARLVWALALAAAAGGRVVGAGVGVGVGGRRLAGGVGVVGVGRGEGRG